MNWKTYADIQRQLGYIEGLAMGVSEDIGTDLTDAVNALSAMIEENIMCPMIEKEICCVEQETGNRF